MVKIVKKQIEFAGRPLSLETGEIAFQANRAVLATYGETVILATVVANELKNEVDYFPLRVDFEEKLYAGGFIKSSRFIKRETKPTDEATVSARLIDHAIRPLFPKDYKEEVQVIVTALSVDPEGDPEVLALVAASAALSASDVPWNGPLGTVRVVLKDGEFVLNPNLLPSTRASEANAFDLDLVVSYLGDRVVATEGEAKMVPEEKLLAAFKFGQEQVKPLLDFIRDFSAAVGVEKKVYVSDKLDADMVAEVQSFAGTRVKEMLSTPLDKLDYVDYKKRLKDETYAQFQGKYTKVNMDESLDLIEKELVRSLILNDGRRPDGRKLDEIRPISGRVGVLPRTHGSAIFTRGLTQALTIATLGSSSLEQLIQTMTGEETKRYMHHYNAPPYSTGETNPLRGPGRRELGHGMLAEKALRPVVPGKDEFPYVIRVVSEILSQNGSTSMASTCGSSLALMDAGVPVKSAVAGIAIGLVTDPAESKYIILTDIAGVEDFDGFLDFKLTGTREGWTALQMDTKLHHGLPIPVLADIIERSKQARLKVLDIMAEILGKPRETLSQYAPRITVIKIDPKKIGEVIGPGGRIIKRIIEETGAEIDIEDDGSVYISAKEDAVSARARAMIEGIVKEAKVGEVYDGRVTRLMDFGAFAEIFPGKEGLIHISEIAYHRVERVEDYLKVGDPVKVKVVGIDEQGRVNLSKKALEPRPAGEEFAGGHESGQRSGSSTSGYRTPFFKKREYQPYRSPGSDRRR